MNVLKLFLSLSILSFLTGCGTNPGKKAESLETVSADKVFQDLKAIVKNSALSPEIKFRESQATFDWRDPLMNTPYGRVPTKIIPFNMPKIIQSSKPRMHDKFRHLEVKTGKYLTICSEFTNAGRNSASAVIPEVFWLNPKNQTELLKAIQYNRNVTTGLGGCLASTFELPLGFSESSKLVIHPKRFDSFIKPIASVQGETMVMAGTILVPIKNVVQILPSVIGQVRFEISDEKKYEQGATQIEDLY